MNPIHLTDKFKSEHGFTRRQVRVCLSKFLRTQEEANAIVQAMWKKGVWRGAYRCKVCSGWHITTKNRRWEYLYGEE
jgi:hypothetical protein